MFVIETQTVPLATDAQGVARVGGTRIPLDTVIAAFLEGDTAEGIVDQYPSISLADVYSVISYYLNHKEQVDQYLIEGRVEADNVRQVVEARINPHGVRQRLMARKSQGG